MPDLAPTTTRIARFSGPNAKRKAYDFFELQIRIVIAERWVRGVLVVTYYELEG